MKLNCFVGYLKLTTSWIIYRTVERSNSSHPMCSGLSILFHIFITTCTYGWLDGSFQGTVKCRGMSIYSQTSCWAWCGATKDESSNKESPSQWPCLHSIRLSHPPNLHMVTAPPCGCPGQKEKWATECQTDLYLLLEGISALDIHQ